MKDALLDSDPDPADQNQYGLMRINANPRGSGSTTMRAVQKGGANAKDNWSGPERRAVVAAAAAAVGI
jgi:hypothetical protein